jgi:nitrilase
MTSGSEVAVNLKRVSSLIESAVSSGARLVVLPENFAQMPANEEQRFALRETEDAGPVQDFLADQAQRHRIWLVGGTLPLACDDPTRVRGACLVYDDQGRRRARYDKIHLFDVTLSGGEDYRESRYFEPGDQVVVCDTPFGRLGLAVCYDLRFPELFREMLRQDAQIIAVPSAFTETTGAAHWEVLVRARAIENQCFMIAANQQGRHDNGRRTFGHSMVVDPWGEVLGLCADGSGIVLAEMDLQRLQQVRALLPSVHHRRLD